MDTPRPIPTGPRKPVGRTRRVISFIGNGFGIAMATALVGAGVFSLGDAIWEGVSTDRKPPAAPTGTAPAAPSGTPITWPTITVQCSDGWPSHSIGKRGACSYHGGVITLYHSSLGDLATLCGPANQPETLERAQALMTAAGVVDCDYGQTPEPTSTPTGAWGPLPRP